jgi:hypothetical protein
LNVAFPKGANQIIFSSDPSSISFPFFPTIWIYCHGKNIVFSVHLRSKLTFKLCFPELNLWKLFSLLYLLWKSILIFVS